MSDKNSREYIYKNSIEIPLHNFNFLHHTHGNDKDKREEKPDRSKGIFFGREDEISKISNILESKRRARGAYLITGYRGCGKTSFINEALQRYMANKKKDEEIYIVKLNLSNDISLDPFQVYKRMAKGLFDEVSRYRNTKRGFLCKTIFPFVSFIVPLLFLFFVLLFSIKYYVSSNLASILDNYSFALTSGIGSLSFVILLLILSVFLIISYSLYVFVRFRYNKNNAYGSLKRLILGIENDLNVKYKMNADVSTSFLGKLDLSPSIGMDKEIKRKSLQTADIEYELNKILNKNISSKSDVIFVFDELDKISKNSLYKDQSLSEGVSKLDELLGSLKNIISENPARFIFIGGRDMHDAYLSQSGAVSSLYQSIFNESIYIPSLLSDGSDKQSFRINSMIEKLCVSFLMPKDKEGNKKENDYSIEYENFRIKYYAKKIKEWKRDEEWDEDSIKYVSNVLFVLRNFVHYLAFQSKGNYKIFLSIFDSFVYKRSEKEGDVDYRAPSYIRRAGGERDDKEATFYLRFQVKDIQKILLNSNLYISFHYHLSRRLRHADDKIIIASISMLQFIVKFYNKGFSRRHLYNMYEVVNTNRSPELKGITEIIIKSVLTSSLRKSRYCITRYRFTSLFENEVRYVSETSADQSAAYNFSLDALNYIKEKYIDEMGEVDKNDEKRLAIYHLALGDFYYWEQSYDDAINAYLLGSELLRETNGYLVYSQTYMELMLKLGLVFETRHNYSEALNIYFQAYKDADFIYQENKKHFPYKYGAYDAKLDYLTQPYWSWLMLNIKRSPNVIEGDVNYPFYINKLYDDNEETLYYKTGVFFYYVNNFYEANKFFRKVIGLLHKKTITKGVNNRDSFLLAKSYLFLAFCKTIDLVKNNVSEEYYKNGLSEVLESNSRNLSEIGKLKKIFCIKNIMIFLMESTVKA